MCTARGHRQQWGEGRGGELVWGGREKGDICNNFNNKDILREKNNPMLRHK